jgi:hypothetical protein
MIALTVPEGWITQTICTVPVEGSVGAFKSILIADLDARARQRDLCGRLARPERELADVTSRKRPCSRRATT